jgi:hypothetical protein
MPTINRLQGSITTLVLAASTSAYAEEPTLTDPPDEVMRCEGDVPADCPAPQPAPQTSAPPPEPAPPPVMTSPPPDVDVLPSQEWYERIGIGLSIGGGVDDFVGDDFRSATSLGGGWNVRATFGTRTMFALEGSYIGSAQDIEFFDIDDDFDGSDATLIGNGLQAAARLNVLPNDAVQPFIYGGAAWRHYDVSGTATGQDTSDDVFEIPVGVGVAGYVAGLMADVRAEYRGAWGSDLGPEITVDDSTIVGEMDRWGVTGSLGAEF